MDELLPASLLRSCCKDGGTLLPHPSLFFWRKRVAGKATSLARMQFLPAADVGNDTLVRTHCASESSRLNPSPAFPIDDRCRPGIADIYCEPIVCTSRSLWNYGFGMGVKHVTSSVLSSDKSVILDSDKISGAIVPRVRSGAGPILRLPRLDLIHNPLEWHRGLV